MNVPRGSIVCGVDATAERDVLCPRCRYNLRGLPAPRCPECGLIVVAEQWRAGVLREHIPTRLDRCDPWQPHQVLLCSLHELIREAAQPRWLATKLDLHGSLRRAGLMLAGGCFWLYLIGATLIGVATYAHTAASPYACLVSAALSWAPRLLLVGLASAGLMFGLVALPACLHVPALSARQFARLGSYWVPAGALWMLGPLACAVLASPAFALGPWMPMAWWLLPAIPALRVIVGRAAGASPRSGRVRAVLRSALLAALWVAGGVCSAGLLPRELEPPLWAYF